MSLYILPVLVGVIEDAVAVGDAALIVFAPP